MLPYKNLSLEDMPGEVWKDIPGYEGSYQASTFGRIKSFLTNRILCQTIMQNNYLIVQLRKDGKTIHQYVHRIVLLTFVPPESKRNQVDHINCIRFDNRIENLRWATCFENHHNSKSEVNYSIANKCMGKPIVCTSPNGDKTEYYSLREAERSGFNRRCIMFCLNGKHKTHKGFSFRYAD